MRMRAERALCDEVAALLPAVLDARADAAPGLVAHVERCLRCQAELARYRRLLRLLAQLRLDERELPTGVVTGVLAEIGGAAKRQVIRSALSGRRLAYASGLLGAALAAMTAVLAARARGARAGRVAGG